MHVGLQHCGLASGAGGAASVRVWSALDSRGSGLFAPRLQLLLELEDPRQLPLAAVRQLLDMPTPADLSLYLEDDLVIQDSRYADKLSWFHQTDHRFVLMPHRREPTVPMHPSICMSMGRSSWLTKSSCLGWR